MIKENTIYKNIAENKNSLLLLSIYVFTFLFFCSKMSPLYPINEWADINVYFNMGKAMMNGRVLYAEAFDHKGPLIFVIYGLGYLISNSSFFGVWLIQLVMWLVLTFALFFTARQFLNTTLSVIVTLFVPYSMLSFMNTGGSAEEFIMIFEAVSLCFFILYFKDCKSKHKPLYMFIHGVLSCATMLIKLNLILFWFFPLLAVFIGLLMKKEYRNFALNCLAYIGGFALVLVPILIYFIVNDALDDAYHVYIELNKQYSSTSDYTYLVSNGFSRLLTTFRANLIWFVILTVGIFYFPIKFCKNRIGAISLTLAGISLIGMVFFPLTFHFYYPLALLIFVTLGLIAICNAIENYIDIKNSKRLACLFAILTTIMAIGNRNLYGMGGAGILRQSYPSGPQFNFKEIILKNESPTLLNIAFGEGNALFTTCNIVPNTKYFLSPNIYYGMYPELRDEQTRYIENKDVDFIISSSEGFNYEYFEALPSLKNNYEKIDSVASKNVMYYLYQKNK